MIIVIINVLCSNICMFDFSFFNGNAIIYILRYWIRKCDCRDKRIESQYIIIEHRS